MTFSTHPVRIGQLRAFHCWGLVKFDWATKPLLTHNGSNSINLATILVDTENDLGITIDTNFPGDKADAGLMELTEMLYKKFAPRPASP